MKLFALNLLIALAWTLVTGELDVGTLAVGFGVGFIVLWLLEPAHGDRDYHRRPWRLAAFVGWYLLDLVLSSLRIAGAVLLPGGPLRAGWLVVRLRTRNDGETTLLANLISLTPGTLSLDVSPDRKLLYVHALLRKEDDEQQVERELEMKLQGRLLRLLGGRV